MNRLSSNHSRDWGDWLKVLAALGIGRHTAMLEAGANEPRGYKYCAAFARWLRCHEAFQAIDQADRKRMFDCWDNLSAIEEWRAGLSPVATEQVELPTNCPTGMEKEPAAGVSRHLRLRHAPPPSAARLCWPQTELRRQLEILGLSRFRQEVMPPDWRTPLADTMLALATTEQLIAMLERKHSPSKAASTALKSLRKSQPPNP